jgi:hypothetical protein
MKEQIMRETGGRNAPALIPIPSYLLILLILLALIYGFSAPPVAAETAFMAGYVEGEVTWRDGSQPVEIGTVLAVADTVYLGHDGYLEIASGDRTVRLVGPGEYRLAELAGDGGERPGFGVALGQRVHRALRNERRGDLAAAGVRGDFGGAEAGDAVTVAQEVRSVAIEALRAGRLLEAEELFDEALLYATGAEEPSIRIDLAELLLGEGRFSDTLAVTDPIPASARNARYYRARGTALHAGEMFESTLELVHESRARELPPETQVHLEGLAADAALALDDRTVAIQALRRITELDPDSVWTVAARRLLGELE